MFEANLKHKVIDEPFNPYLNITIDILLSNDNSQYYTPILTFFIISYVYVTTGEGIIWKYLFKVSFSGFIASALAAIVSILKQYYTIDYVIQLKWIEGIFWHFNDYGYVYITYLKLKIVVDELKKEYWQYIMKILFVYNLLIRFYISTAIVMGRKNSAASHLQVYSLLPLALFELTLIYLIFKTFKRSIKEDDACKEIIHTMERSSLKRMALVGLIYFLTSLVCYFYNPAILKMIKNFIWRIKNALGLVFLLDFILTRVELNEKMKSYKLNINRLEMPEDFKIIDDLYDSNDYMIQSTSKVVEVTPFYYIDQNPDFKFINNTASYYSEQSSNASMDYNNPEHLNKYKT